MNKTDYFVLSLDLSDKFMTTNPGRYVVYDVEGNGKADIVEVRGKRMVAIHEFKSYKKLVKYLEEQLKGKTDETIG